MPYLNYLNWAGSPHKLKQLREPKVVMSTFTEDQARLLLRYKPKTDFQRRLHLLILVLFDTVARISEVLGLQSDEVDLDNMLLRLRGEGSQRTTRAYELRVAQGSVQIHGWQTRSDIYYVERNTMEQNRGLKVG